MIWAAFRKTGIWPINHDAFSNADFAPSVHTSNSAHDVPDSYPVYTDTWPEHQSRSDDDPISADEDDNEKDGSDEQRREAHQSAASSSLPTHQLTPPAITGSSCTSTTFDLDGPIPPAHFYSKVPKPVCCGCNTEAYVSALKNQVTMLQQENEELVAHATLAYDHVWALKHHLNAKVLGSK
jgi:hypothetical protein